jgi:phage tail sheath protein FI
LDAAIIGSPALSTGLYAFQNPESYDINLITTPGFSSGAVIGTALQMCEARGDVLYLIDPPFGLRPQQVVDWHNGMLLSDLSSAINSSYGALYWSWVKVFDQFSRTEIWIPPSGHVSAVFSRTARDTEQWFAPAGLRRGRLLTALDVEYSPSQGERELLYGFGNAVNPLAKFPQQGIVVWGQRTLQREDTALDRVNVRMLNIFLKKNLSVALRSYIFEPNDRILWSQVQSAVESFMADVLARRGVTAYKVVCDSSNNTPERVDRNELWVSVFYQPTQTVEFVVLNLVVLRTGGSFSAEEVLAAAGIVQ